MKNDYERNMRNLRRYLDLYAKRHVNHYGTPLMLSILITNKCNLKCKHCFYHETLNKGSEFPELTLEEYERISKGMSNFLTGIFCGGEPFMRPDMSEIIRIFQKNNNMMLADSASNGQFTDNILEQVEKILKASPYLSFSLGISFEGFKNEHDNIRGTGTFDNALLTWRELKKLKKHYSKFELYICSTINTLNEQVMSDFLEWAYDFLEPEKVSLLKVRQSPRAGDEIKRIDLLNYLNCIEVIEKHINQLDTYKLNKPQTYLLSSINNYIFDGEINHRKQFVCYGGLHGGFIDYNGDVSVCEVMPTIGNLRDFDYNFDLLWNSQSANVIRNNVNSSEKCSICSHEAEGLLPSLYFEPNEMKYLRKNNGIYK
jgi:MoaA/NifB/PqqE/SkfB family radical SAM enzyme